MFRLRAALLWACISLVSAQGTNKYYSSPGNISGYCTISSCNPSACAANQYLLGCSFNVSGTCTTCTNTPAAGQYFSSNGQYSPTGCVSSACISSCSNGQYTANCGNPSTSPGACTACSTILTLNANSNYLPYTGATYVCAQQAWPTCSTGYTNPTANTISNGLCVACTNTPTAGNLYASAQQYTAASACAWTACAGPTAGNYFTTANSCTQAAQIACGPGYTQTGATTTSYGSCTPCSAPPANNYFTTANSCVYSAWNTCSAGQYLSGGSTTNPGTCTACANSPSAGQYYTPAQQFTSTCALSSCTVVSGSYFATPGSCVATPWTNCSAGYTNPTATSISNGQCVACNNGASNTAGYYWNPAQQYTAACAILQCSAPAAYYYFTTAGSCATAPMTVCSAGLYNNNGGSIYLQGVCTACPLSSAVYYTANANAGSNCPSSTCTSDCGVGNYRKGCGGTTPTSAGSCQACSGANATQEYTTTGGLTDSCTIAGCSLTCLTGQYIANCGGPAGGLACAACTNAVPGVTYYYGGQGTYYPNTCPTQPCPVFGNGYYNAGCGGTSAGSPAACTNV